MCFLSTRFWFYWKILKVLWLINNTISESAGGWPGCHVYAKKSNLARDAALSHHICTSKSVLVPWNDMNEMRKSRLDAIPNSCSRLANCWSYLLCLYLHLMDQNELLWFLMSYILNLYNLRHQPNKHCPYGLRGIRCTTTRRCCNRAGRNLMWAVFQWIAGNMLTGKAIYITCLVIKGYKQIPNVNYTESYAPVTSDVTNQNNTHRNDVQRLATILVCPSYKQERYTPSFQMLYSIHHRDNEMLMLTIQTWKADNYVHEWGE